MNKYMKYKTKYLNNVHGGMLQITYDNKVYGNFMETTWNFLVEKRKEILNSVVGTFISCGSGNINFHVVKYIVFEKITIYIVVRSDNNYNIVIDDMDEFETNITSLSVDYSNIDNYPSGDSYLKGLKYKDHADIDKNHPDHPNGTCFKIHGTYSHEFWYRMTL